MALSFTSEVDMHAPPEAFFDAFRDRSDWAGWMAGFVDVERLTAGEFGVGTRWRETRRILGREAREVFEVTAWHPPRAVSLYVDGRQGTTGRGEFRFHYELTPRATGTHVRLRGEIAMPGRLSQLLARLFLGTFRKSCARDLRALARHLEQAAATAPPAA